MLRLDPARRCARLQVEEGQIEGLRTVMPPARPELGCAPRKTGFDAVGGAPDAKRQGVENRDQAVDTGAQTVAAGATDRT